MDDVAGSFDPARIVQTLHDHGVAYVLVGGVAARLHGSPTLTEDLDVTPEPTDDNLGALADALVTLGARLAVDGVDGGLEVPLDARTFSSPVMKFLTDAGEIDVVLDPVGTGGYEPLRERAVAFRVVGVGLAVASLDDIIRSKETADRPKDRAHLETLRQLRDELTRRRGSRGPE